MNSFTEKPLTYEVDMPNRNKRLKELILYVSDRCASNDNFGATMLNKILWASDFLSYRWKRKPITGEPYQRLERGPAPKHLIPIRNEMEARGELAVRKIRRGQNYQNRTMALREPNLSIFSGDDIALVNSVIDGLWSMHSGELSEWSHGRAWKTHNDGDPMAYESTFLSDEPITNSDILKTQQLAKEFGWHETLYHVNAK